MGYFEQKISQFPAVLKWAAAQDVQGLSEFLQTGAPGSGLLFIASGGSFSAASFAESLAADKHFMARATTPYMYCGGGLAAVPAKVVLISASGRNKDIQRAFANATACPSQKVAAITLRDNTPLHTAFSNSGEPNMFTFPQPFGSDGFLSSATLLATYVILHKAFGFEGAEEISAELSPEDKSGIEGFVGKLKDVPLDELTDQEAFLHKLEGVDCFYIMHSAKSYMVALDIESKFTEGAIGNTKLSDYRNFAHGRFNWFTQRPAQTGLICLQTPHDAEMSEEIIGMLPSHVPVLRIGTRHTDHLGSIDLLIKANYLCGALAKRWGLDLCKPAVPKYGNVLYWQ